MFSYRRALSLPRWQRKGLFLGDHGLLWQTPWTAEVKDGRVVMAREIPELQIHFERTCVLDGEQSLELAYRITNAADEPLKYVYSAHPILAAGPDTRVMLPDEMDRAYVIFVANVDGVEPQNWIDWPPGVPNLQPPYTATRKSCLKVVSPQLANGVAFVQHQDRGEGLQLEFDAAELPHLGVLIQQGYDADDNGAFQGEVLLALEPTTGIGDDLPTCASTQTLAELGPGQSKSFSIRLTLVGL
jgi:galactose mutarotase-like enzyme